MIDHGCQGEGVRHGVTNVEDVLAKCNFAVQ
jgi:hypothetical protein